MINCEMVAALQCRLVLLVVLQGLGHDRAATASRRCGDSTWPCAALVVMLSGLSQLLLADTSTSDISSPLWWRTPKPQCVGRGGSVLTGRSASWARAL